MPDNNTLDASLSSFLTAIGISRGAVVKLGNSEEQVVSEPSREQRDQLLRDLALAGSGSRKIVWLWVVLIAIIFILSCVFAYYYKDDIKFVAATILGGSGVMAYLLSQVRSVHKKLVSTQILLALLPNLPPAEWARAAQVLLDEILKAPVQQK